MTPTHEQQAARMRARPTALPTMRPPASVTRLITAASQRFSVLPRYIRDGHQRSGAACAARRHIARELHALGYSSTVIGYWLGGLHHSSVLYMLGGARGRKRRGAQPGELGPVPVPDESGVWAI